MLGALALAIHRRARAVLAVVVLGAIAAGALGAGVSKRLSPYGAEDPSKESVRASRVFEHAAGRRIDPDLIAIVTPGTPGGIRTPAAHHAADRVVGTLRSGPDVALVRSAWNTGNAALFSRDGRSTYLLAWFRPRSDKVLSDDAKAIAARFAGRRDVLLGGYALTQEEVNTQVSHDLAVAELFAFPLIFVLSLIFFRSGAAAFLPPLIGGLSIVFTLLALRVLSEVSDISVFAVNLVTGMGLGLAIDYCLFIVSRYREEAARGGAYDAAALARTLQSAGRTVLFSSLTVAAAIASLNLFPQRFLYSMGIGGTIVALLAMVLALVVLPAVLALLGPRVNALSPGWLQRAAERDARPARAGVWYRLSRAVAARPGPIAASSAALLIALGLPFAGIRFTTADATILPPSAQAYRADLTLHQRFSLAGATQPIEVLVAAPARSNAARRIATQLRSLPGARAVSPPEPVGARLALVNVVPPGRFLDPRSLTLTQAIRSLRTSVPHMTTGASPFYEDLRSSLGAHIAPVLLWIGLTTFTVLFLFTGSLILPLKAIVMNLLTISATFGLLVLVFQDGRLQGLLDYRSQGALEISQPVLLFVIAFGLATDYGVFLLSRIKEAHDAGVPSSEAVGIGLERTGRIVTAAALLFAVAVGAFATSKIIFIKEFAIGTSAAVLLDASIIRGLLVPALMALLGSLNWWAPRPLRCVYERFGLAEPGTVPSDA